MADITEAEIQNLTRELVQEVPPDRVDQVEFRGAQFDRGLALVQFPEGLGGLGLSSRRLQTVVDAELRAAGVTYHDLNVNPIGIGMGAPVVLTYASEELKHRLLRPMFLVRKSGANCLASPGRGQTWLAYPAGPCETATSGASTGRRCGPLWLMCPSGGCWWPELTQTSPSTRA